jgi:hypothetical protein
MCGFAYLNVLVFIAEMLCNELYGLCSFGSLWRQKKGVGTFTFPASTSGTAPSKLCAGLPVDLAVRMVQI